MIDGPEDVRSHSSDNRSLQKSPSLESQAEGGDDGQSAGQGAVQMDCTCEAAVAGCVMARWDYWEDLLPLDRCADARRAPGVAEGPLVDQDGGRKPNWIFELPYGRLLCASGNLQSANSISSVYHVRRCAVPCSPVWRSPHPKRGRSGPVLPLTERRISP